MPSSETVKQFLTGVILPPAVGVATTWLVGKTGVLNVFHINEQQIQGQLTLAGTWGISTVIAFLVKDKILKGGWLPSAVKHERAVAVAKASAVVVSPTRVEHVGNEEKVQPPVTGKEPPPPPTSTKLPPAKTTDQKKRR